MLSSSCKKCKNNWYSIQMQLEQQVFSEYHPSISKKEMESLTLKVEEILSKWVIDTSDIMDEGGCIDVIDFIEDKLCVIRGFDIPIEWLSIVYDTIINQVDSNYRMTKIWVELPIYIQDVPHIMHFLHRVMKNEYQCNVFLDVLNKELSVCERDLGNEMNIEYIEVLKRYILCNIIKICEFICEDTERDYILTHSYIEDAKTSKAKKVFFEERWCWLTNIRLDTCQNRFNEIAPMMSKINPDDKDDNDNKIYKNRRLIWEEWQTVSNRYYKIANKLSAIILNSEFEWVQAEKQQLYNSIYRNGGVFLN